MLESLLIKSQALGLAILLKRDSNTSLFPVKLVKKFLKTEHNFYRTSPVAACGVGILVLTWRLLNVKVTAHSFLAKSHQIPRKTNLFGSFSEAY